jgi:hypothetical protein
MSARIDITLELMGQQIDYQVPSEITFARFNELMHHALVNARLPEHWTLALKYSDLMIDDSDLLKDLSIGTGDVFYIVPLTGQEARE